MFERDACKTIVFWADFPVKARWLCGGEERGSVETFKKTPPSEKLLGYTRGHVRMLHTVCACVARELLLYAHCEKQGPSRRDGFCLVYPAPNCGVYSLQPPRRLEVFHFSALVRSPARLPPPPCFAIRFISPVKRLLIGILADELEFTRDDGDFIPFEEWVQSVKDWLTARVRERT